MPPERLAHHFQDLEQQHGAASLGMWVFLAQEVLFFGGLFAGYAVYRFLHGRAFELGSQALDVRLGTANTVVLIGSSLTVALAVRAAALGAGRAIAGWLMATLGLAATFLVVKAAEYVHACHEGHVPGAAFHFDGPPEAEIFFSFYFVLTGMHALHMLIGVGIMLWLAPVAWHGGFPPARQQWIENFGLYWHFVDIVWIFLFPLLYLLGRHA